MAVHAISLLHPRWLPGSGNSRRIGRLRRWRTRTVLQPLPWATIRRSVRAITHVLGKRREMQRIMAARRQDSEARINRETPEPKEPARLKAIVRHGCTVIRSLVPPAANLHGPRRQATTATAQAHRTVAVLSSLRSGRSVMRQPTTAIAALPTAVALTSHRSGCNGTHRLTTTTGVIRSRALTIRRPHARTRRRELIPHRAAATQLRHAPTRHRAAAAVVEVAAIAAAAAAEVHAAAEAPPLTAGTNLFANLRARPDLPGGFFLLKVML
jgi:hypothetical protein